MCINRVAKRLFMAHGSDLLVAGEPGAELGVEGVPQLVATLEGYYSMRMHVLTRFGRWSDIVAAPMPVDPEL